jgi:hypothetical protein
MLRYHTGKGIDFLAYSDALNRHIDFLEEHPFDFIHWELVDVILTAGAVCERCGVCNLTVQEQEYPTRKLSLCNICFGEHDEDERCHHCDYGRPCDDGQPCPYPHW